MMGKLCAIVVGLSCCYILYSFTTIHYQKSITNIVENNHDSVAFLGKLLFYDPVLSSNGNISCASCHEQKLAFTDGTQLSNRGVNGELLLRNVPGLFNLAKQSAFFWDGGAVSLEAQVFGPLTSPDEMGSDLKEIVDRLKHSKLYPRLFQKYFHKEISSYTIAKAIAEFERSIVSYNSQFDQYIKSNASSKFSLKEEEGYKLFKTYCENCHSGIDFTDGQYHNNGLDVLFDSDTLEGIFQGRYRITSDTNDLGKYKTPSIRNIAVTAPYMHDGRFKTLYEVVDRYSNGIVISPTLDNYLQTTKKGGFHFSDGEKSAVVAFLKTLTDSSFLSNPKYSDPFIHN